ncbi:hypothetical protein DSO57_1032446 [Entomophthora muscae]|nr:hypothetical protein DSO57_1032446 [Entomophthora muscae]
MSHKDLRFCGRSILVKEDPVRSFHILHSVLKSNNVRKELALRRYYEKPTLKRRRLKMEANREAFKEAVGKKVGLVLKLKNRGI